MQYEPSASIAGLIAEGEGKTVEFKEQFPANDNIAKTVVAFSNTAGGKLIIGVDDGRHIVGIDPDSLFDLQDKIASIIFDSCYPNILPEIYTINADGVLVLVVEVFRGNLLPYFIKSAGKSGGVYVRLGATNRKADTQMVMELERQRRHISFDEEIAYDISLDSLDLKPIYKRFEQSGKSLDQQKLINLKLVKKEHGQSHPTNGLLILLGYFPHCTVKCARFKGETTELFLDKKEYHGTLFDLLDGTLTFILNHIHLRGEIKELARTDTYEIPLVALRETLVNALIHRDYVNGGRDIKVGIFDQIVTIVSPGGFPHSITKADLENGRSETRNRVIAHVFKELGLIEQWGTGIARIRSACLAQDLQEPSIDEKNDYVEVAFVRPIATDTARLRPITTDYDQLIPEEARILDYLHEHSSISRKEATQLLGLGETKIKEIFNALMNQGLIERFGAGRSTSYRLVVAKGT